MLHSSLSLHIYMPRQTLLCHTMTVTTCNPNPPPPSHPYLASIPRYHILVTDLTGKEFTSPLAPFHLRLFNPSTTIPHQAPLRLFNPSTTIPHQSTPPPHHATKSSQADVWVSGGHPSAALSAEAVGGQGPRLTKVYSPPIDDFMVLGFFAR